MLYHFVLMIVLIAISAVLGTSNQISQILLIVVVWFAFSAWGDFISLKKTEDLIEKYEHGGQPKYFVEELKI